MKKLICVLVVLLLCSPVWADRVQELKEEAQVLVETYNKYQVEMQEIRIRLIKIEGILEELNKEE